MKLAIALAAFVFTAGTAQAATTLTFDGDVCSLLQRRRRLHGLQQLHGHQSGAYGDGGGVDVSYAYETGI